MRDREVMWDVELHRGRRTDHGFTLIELLVVIAVIVILATILLVPLGQIRVKARNASIQEDIDQMRVIAEDVFDSNGGVGYCGPTLACADVDPRMDVLKSHIDKANGTQGAGPILFAGNTFCVEAVLADGTSYCADSNGAYTGPIAGQGAGHCASGVCE